MRIDGKEFLRNVGIEEDKQNLKKAQEKLDEQKREFKHQEPGFFDNDPSEDESVSLNISSSPNLENNDFNNLHDIKLDPGANSNNKKKYIILIASLILLFIITIVIIRLISNSQEEDKLAQSASSTMAIEKDNQLNNIKTDEEYENIIQKQEDKLHFKQETPMEKKEIILPEPVKEKAPVKIEPKKSDAPQKDLFGLTKETAAAAKPQETQKTVEKTVEKKKEEVKKVFQQIDKPAAKKQAVETPKVTNFVKKEKTITANNGYFIQVGSFSKKPSDSFLNNITKKGYKYKIHQTDVKGKRYNKVLIGVYPSYNTAKKDLGKVRKDLKAPGAYILKL